MGVFLLTAVYDLVSGLHRSSKTSYAHILAELSKIDRRLSNIEEQQSMIISAIAINPVLRSNVVRDTDTGQLTRSVMQSVPAILISILWSRYRSNEPISVSMDFLMKVFKSIGHEYEIDVRRELGSIFSQVIKSPSNVSIAAISSPLSDSCSTKSCIMRSHICDLYNKMCGSYAFIFPESLSEFACRIDSIDTTGQISFVDGPIDPRTKKSKMAINPSRAFSAVGPEFIISPQVTKFLFDNKHRESRKFLNGLCATLSNGQVPTDKEARNLGFKQDTPLDSLFGDVRVGVPPTPSRQTGTPYNPTVRGSRAESLFQTTKRR
jgi:hypothetical protein